MATPSTNTRHRLLAWVSWDWGSAAFNAVTLTFVFSVYLTDVVGKNLNSSVNASAWLSGTMAVAGTLIALSAPIAGRQADQATGRTRSMTVWTLATVATMVAMFTVRDSPSYFALGLVLLAVGSITFQFAEIAYFAMIRDVSTPQTIGRISGLGWGAGYVGGVSLLAFGFFAFINGDDTTRGFLNVPTDAGLNVRLLVLCSAAWFLLFAVPLMFTAQRATTTTTQRQSIKDAYRELFKDIAELYRHDRACIRFLVASAVFRDGLAAIFALGAILAVTSYDVPNEDILLFGIAANVTAAVGAVCTGWFDDKFGPKVVIMCALTAIVVCIVVLLQLSGAQAFWALGLTLAVFLGPAQSASRTFLTRLTPPGQEGRMFGLYATAGRAVSFLAPAVFAAFTAVSGSEKVGFYGIAAVIAVGLVLLIGVPKPRDKASLSA